MRTHPSLQFTWFARWWGERRQCWCSGYGGSFFFFVLCGSELGEQQDRKTIRLLIHSVIRRKHCDTGHGSLKTKNSLIHWVHLNQMADEIGCKSILWTSKGKWEAFAKTYTIWAAKNVFHPDVQQNKLWVRHLLQNKISFLVIIQFVPVLGHFNLKSVKNYPQQNRCS